MDLTEHQIDEYRSARFGELTQRKAPPSPATLDREIELLNRTYNFGVRRKLIPSNPISEVKLLRKPNVRRTVLTEEDLETIRQNLPNAVLSAALLVKYDTGLRKRELLDLEHGTHLDLRKGVIRLAPQDTKTKQARTVYLTERCKEALKELVTSPDNKYVFPNPATGKPYQDIRRAFGAACKKAGLANIWLHDLRRSFVTNARRAGVPESVVMRMSGHRTRAVFDRYNIVSEDDLLEAVKLIEKRTRQPGMDPEEAGEE